MKLSFSSRSGLPLLPSKVFTPTSNPLQYVNRFRRSVRRSFRTTAMLSPVLAQGLGTVVMVMDMLKGIIAVKLALLLPEYADSEVNLQNLQTGLGLAAVIGHIFPIWAEFRGGKGVATLFGLVLGISPWTALSCVGIFMLVLYLTRFVSLSSILASIAFPVFILVIFNVDNPLYRVFAIAVALMVLLTHQKNIGRLLRGNESKMPIFRGRDRRRQRDNNA